MHRVLSGLKGAIALLLVAVLVIVPVADAFACSLESGEAHAATAAGDDASQPRDDAGQDGAPGGPHGVCAHNHCHHATANIFFDATVGYDIRRAMPLVRHESTRASGMSEGPLRPPRS